MRCVGGISKSNLTNMISFWVRQFKAIYCKIFAVCKFKTEEFFERQQGRGKGSGTLRRGGKTRADVGRRGLVPR